MAVGNIKSRLIDVFTPAAASSDLQIQTRTGGQPTEVPPRSPTQISGRKEVRMVPDGHAVLQGLSSIPHLLTSVVAAFYRSDIISGSETSVDRARAMMHKFAVVALARLIDNGGPQAVEALLAGARHCLGPVLNSAMQTAASAGNPERGRQRANAYKQGSAYCTAFNVDPPSRGPATTDPLHADLSPTIQDGRGGLRSTRRRTGCGGGSSIRWANDVAHGRRGQEVPMTQSVSLVGCECFLGVITLLLSWKASATYKNRRFPQYALG
ncbi:hypothetical protein THAOC_20383 [Thalassiosira oceanica]|uniref:DUF6820 domain-containing protein n=1 Tax=Thalassiosira oceanica TaxID=159749 RepID=K0S2C5_THAOC|nr:hypothetical protein THAOC_20383 [Thalassiosira oceanica]|eukprot:EJK59400.1 hypothetical protein THAOC_20383 [Thalassiosira oceanica]